MSYNALQAIAKGIQQSNESPMVTIDDSANSITYIVYAPITIGSVTGYKVRKITSTSTGTIISNGFLPESLRKSGANGSVANVDLKEDATNAILLLSDTSISFG